MSGMWRWEVGDGCHPEQDVELLRQGHWRTCARPCEKPLQHLSAVVMGKTANCPGRVADGSAPALREFVT